MTYRGSLPSGLTAFSGQQDLYPEQPQPQQQPYQQPQSQRQYQLQPQQPQHLSHYQQYKQNQQHPDHVQDGHLRAPQGLYADGSHDQLRHCHQQQQFYGGQNHQPPQNGQLAHQGQYHMSPPPPPPPPLQQQHQLDHPPHMPPPYTVGMDGRFSTFDAVHSYTPTAAHEQQQHQLRYNDNSMQAAVPYFTQQNEPAASRYGAAESGMSQQPIQRPSPSLPMPVLSQPHPTYTSSIPASRQLLDHQRKHQQPSPMSRPRSTLPPPPPQQQQQTHPAAPPSLPQSPLLQRHQQLFQQQSPQQPQQQLSPRTYPHSPTPQQQPQQSLNPDSLQHHSPKPQQHQPRNRIPALQQKQQQQKRWQQQQQLSPNTQNHSPRPQYQPQRRLPLPEPQNPHQPQTPQQQLLPQPQPLASVPGSQPFAPLHRETASGWQPPTAQNCQAPAHHEVHFVNPQDILNAPAPPPPADMGNLQSFGPKVVSEPTSAKPQPAEAEPSKSPPTQSHSSVNPLSKRMDPRPDPLRMRSSPHSSVSNSPALSARSPNMAKKSPAIPSKPRPVNTAPIMVAIAEECLHKARSSVHDVAMSLHPQLVDEYQKLIVTSLSCLEATLQNCQLPPRDEARLRLRYAATLQEETDNLMEAEMALGKGITLCDKHRLIDLKYCMQYLMLKVLFQRSHKAALKAVDDHIYNCETFKHVQWYYAFRLLKTAFYMEMGGASDAGALENIRSVQHIATTRGDNALSVLASLLEGFSLLKTSKDGSIERVQACLAQAAKFQLDPTVQIVQLDILVLLLDLASSLNHQSPENTAQKLRLLQKRLDGCEEWHNMQSEFLVPIKKQPTTAKTVGEETAAIVRAGNAHSPFDHLVMSFMTKVELRSLVFTLSGLAHLHKPATQIPRSSELWREGLKILESWDQSTANIPYGPPISLATAIRQRSWRTEAQAYLNALLGLMMASHCQWENVKQAIGRLDSLVTPATQPMVRLLYIYLTGVYRQGIGDLGGALHIYLDRCFAIPQGSASVKAGQREMALLAGLNRLWIMQHPSWRNERETQELVEQLQPHCTDHWNLDLRCVWHNVVAGLETEPPQQLNQQKQHIQTALNGSKMTSNTLSCAVALCILQSRFFENVIGEQALKSARAAAVQAQRSGNLLWQSVADGMLAQSYEVQGQRDESRQEWEKATREAKDAFAGS